MTLTILHKKLKISLELFTLTIINLHHRQNETSGYVCLWKSTEILVLGPNLCTRILIMHHDWPISVIINLPIRLKEISKHISSYSLSLLGAQNMDIIAASQKLLTGVRLSPRCRLAKINDSLPQKQN